MGSNYPSLVTGIVSGILTSAILFLILQLFNKVIVPWYQSVIYRGVDISGDWFMSIEGSKPDCTCEIEQRAHKIKGKINFTKDHETGDNATDTISIYSLEGEISNRFVNFSLKHTNKKRLGIGSCLIEVVDSGRKMEGFMINNISKKSSHLTV